MKVNKVFNEYYSIDIDDEYNLLYLTLYDKELEKYNEKNIINNILSHFMIMDKGFKLILDLSYYNPLQKIEWFDYTMDRIAKRMSELKAGQQAHVLNDIFWYIVWTIYPEHIYKKPIIMFDDISQTLLGRFDTVQDAENWIKSF